MFVGALAVPEAFGGHGVVFGVAFLIVALMQLALYALAARGDPDLLQAILRITPSSIAGATLIAVAGFVHGGLKPVLWLIALALGFFAPLVARPSGWRLHAAHFIERHGSIVIIAIGESLVAVGLGVRHGGLGAEEIGAAVLGFVVAAAFWLAYFDFFTIRAQQLLDDRSGVQQIALARDTYTYLHLPMVVGIVLFAFAVKTTLGDVHAELSIVPALALCGGPALFLLAFVGLRFRVARAIGGGRLVAAVVCAALVPAALAVQAIVALALVTAVWVVLHAYELIWWRAARAELRAQREPASAS